MKIYLGGILTALALILSASSTMAAGTRKVTATIKGTLSGSNAVAGACSAVTDANGTDSYDTICNNLGSCTCINATNLPLSGGFGAGKAAIFLTVDTDSSVTTGAGMEACAPAFGVLSLSVPARGKIAAKTQTLDVLGAVCGTAGRTAVTALGGFSIAASTADSSGSGTFNGALSQLGALTLKISGSITGP